MEVSMAPPPPSAAPDAVMVEIVNGDYRCHPCVAICNTRPMLDMHLQGKRHQSKIALCGGASVFKPLTDLPDLPPRESQTLSPAGRKRKNASAQGSFRCDVCEIDFPSAFPFESHMQGKKHMNKVQKTTAGDSPSTVSCEICSVSTPDKDAYEKHVNGKKHLAKVAKMEGGGGDNEAAAKADFRCEVCSVSATNADTLALHMQGKKHQAKINKADKPEQQSSFQCEFCNVSCPNEEAFEAHRNGKKHAEKVRKIAEGASGEPTTFPCELCNISLNSQAILDTHLSGKKHLKAVADGEKAKNGGAAAAETTFKCDVCNVAAPSQEDLDKHLNGKRHQKAIGGGGGGVGGVSGENGVSPAKAPKKEIDLTQFYCEICSLQLNGPATMDTHMNGKAHAKKAAALNQAAASSLATSFVKSVREEMNKDVTMEGDTSAPAAQPQQVAPVAPQPAAPIPTLKNEQTVPGSPARSSRTRR